ncbi:hypothetical protein HYX05_02660 [Candidatus Woesearchaeota archaeon]|nr:hypothetical protein [Candidatus Woesearchaeota archaeon]
MQLKNAERLGICSDKWKRLEIGDVVRYKDRRFMFMGIDANGGPGRHAHPEPMFGPAHPKDDYAIFFLRHLGRGFPKHIYGEHIPPAQFGTLPWNIGFLNATRPDLKKNYHISAEDWYWLNDPLGILWTGGGD